MIINYKINKKNYKLKNHIIQIIYYYNNLTNKI